MKSTVEFSPGKSFYVRLSKIWQWISLRGRVSMCDSLRFDCSSSPQWMGSWQLHIGLCVLLTLDLPAIQTRESLTRISIFLERIHVIPLYPINFSPTHIKRRIISSIQPQCRSMDKKRTFLPSNKLLLSLLLFAFVLIIDQSILRIADNREGCWSDQSLLQFHRSRWSLCFLSKFRSSKL